MQFKTDFNIIKNNKMLFFICVVFLIITGVVATFSIMYSAAFIVLVLLTIALIYFPKLIIVYIVVVYENFFYLIDIEKLGYFYTGKQIAGIIVCVLLIFFAKNIIYEKYIFKFEVSFFIAIIFIASVVAYYKYGQTFMESLYTDYLYFGILAYFVFREIYKGKEASEKMINYLIMIGTALTLVFIAQYFAYDIMKFMYVTYSERYNDIRLHEATSLIPFTVIMTFNKLICNNKRRIYLLISFLLQVFCLVSISKSRTIIIGIFVSFLVILILQKKIKLRVVISCLLVIVLCFSLLMFLNIITTEFVSSIIDEIQNSGGTVGIRYEATHYFQGVIKENPIFGTGILNIDIDKAYFISGLRNDYYFMDVGIIGYVTMLGLLGLIGAIFLFVKTFIISLKVYRNDSNIIFPLALMVMQISIMLTVFWLLENVLYFTILLVYLDNVYMDQISLKGVSSESINDIPGSLSS